MSDREIELLQRVKDKPAFTAKSDQPADIQNFEAELEELGDLENQGLVELGPVKHESRTRHGSPILVVARITPAGEEVLARQSL